MLTVYRLNQTERNMHACIPGRCPTKSQQGILFTADFISWNSASKHAFTFKKVHLDFFPPLLAGMDFKSFTAELEKPPEALLVLDTDNDGKISPEEIKAELDEVGVEFPNEQIETQGKNV